MSGVRLPVRSMRSTPRISSVDRQGVWVRRRTTASQLGHLSTVPTAPPYSRSRPIADSRLHDAQVQQATGHLRREDLAEHARGSVAIQVSHRTPPVAPNRSVFTRSGGWPMETSKLATDSTIGVGPQT